MLLVLSEAFSLNFLYLNQMSWIAFPAKSLPHAEVLLFIDTQEPGLVETCAFLVATAGKEYSEQLLSFCSPLLVLMYFCLCLSVHHKFCVHTCLQREQQKFSFIIFLETNVNKPICESVKKVCRMMEKV